MVAEVSGPRFILYPLFCHEKKMICIVAFSLLLFCKFIHLLMFLLFCQPISLSLTFNGLASFSLTLVFQLFSAFDLYLCALLPLPIGFPLGGLVLHPVAGGAGLHYFLGSSLHRQGHAV